MSRNFDSNNNTPSIIPRAHFRAKFKKRAHPENHGLGTKQIIDLGFVERAHYGVIDASNNSVIPKEEFIVDVGGAKVFDFVADSYSLMKLNIQAAVSKGLLPSDGAFAELKSLMSYENPRLKYGEYLKNILQNYNETHKPSLDGNNSISSYEGYVNNFFKFFFNGESDVPLTMTRWLTSYNSSILDTGLAIKYYDIPYDADQRKIDEIIDDPAFQYFKNLCLNMGFNIVSDNPNIILYDLNSPAGASIRQSYGLNNLVNIFDNRFTNTYNTDMELLYSYINIYYNKYVSKFSFSRRVTVKCGKTTSEYITLEPVQQDKRIYNSIQETSLYAKIRNKEEGMPFSPQEMRHIINKSNYLAKKLDKSDGLGYTNKRFASQVWNKRSGYHDFKQKVIGRTQTEAQRQQAGDTSYSPTSGGSSGGSSY